MKRTVNLVLIILAAITYALFCVYWVAAITGEAIHPSSWPLSLYVAWCVSSVFIPLLCGVYVLLRIK